MTEQNYTEEIDLGYLLRKLNDFVKKCIRAFFMILNFFLKYWIVTLALVIIGIGYGYYTDATSKKTFKNEGFIIPNFESVDYLYNTIDELNKRIHNNDTVFLKELLGSNYKALKKVNIEPIADIYNMMTKSREQIDVFRILYQNQELDKFIDNITTSKHFKFHKITFSVRGENQSEHIFNSLLTSWNNSPHFQNYHDIYLKNAEFQVEKYYEMIAQVDSIVKAISMSAGNNQGTGVAISDNTNLHLLLAQKKAMLTDLLDAEIRLNDYTDPVKLVYMDYDVEVGSVPNIFKYPIFLVGLFGFIFLIRFLIIEMKKIAYS